ncbi:hypothetical protein ACFOU2_22085 [Bacillus songklensis]|uniref:Uncharacterized protein n=1 Tax=Bacillus songklensis TaxID=1069116 RepID=A0ABV8B9G7_9BACI
MPRMGGPLGDITITNRNGEVLTGVRDQVTSALGIDLSDADANTVMNMTNDKALAYKEEMGGTGNFDDCVTIVAAGCAAGGAALGGPVGAALSTGAGVPAARLACGRIYRRPE